MRTRVVLLLLFVLSEFLPAKAQTDTSFWFAAPYVIGGDRRDTPIYIRVMPISATATVKIYCPANPSFTPITATIPAGGVSSVKLTNYKSLLVDSLANSVLNRGIKIESDQMITAYYDESSERNPEIYALKGVNSLGNNFYIPGQRQWFNNTADNGTRKAYNAFDIVATQDGTTVTITPSRAITGHAAGVSFTVTLNAGQTYCCRATGQTGADHLGSSTVISDKPIAVTVVDDFVNLTGCSDAGGDQLVPVTLWGTEYIAVNGYITDSPYDRIAVMAQDDNTVVYLNGSTTAWKTLSKGQSEEYAYTGAPVYVNSSKPVSVMHVTGIGCELSYAVLPPLGTCIGSKVVGIVRPGTYDCYLLLVAPNTAGVNSSFSITTTTGTTAISSSYFGSVTGTTAWQYARVPLSTAIYPSGSFGKITSSQNIKFHAGIIYGVTGVGGSYGYFSNYAISPTVSPPDDTVFCNGQSTGMLKFTSTVNNSTFAWVNDNTSIGLAASGTTNIASFVAYNPSDTIAYAHVSVVPSANDCIGPRRTFTIVVNPTPKLVVGKMPKAVCVPSTVNITADSITTGSTAGMTLYYYTDRNATTTMTTPKRVTASGWYYIQGKSSAGCLSNIDSVKVIINDTPKVVITNPAAVCPGVTVDITSPAIVAGSTSGLTYGYYTDPTSGVQYTTPTAAPAGTYYIIGTNTNGCSSSPLPVYVTNKVNAVAADITLTAPDVCIGSSATITATSTLTNPVFNWYSDTALTNLIATGSTYTVPALTANTTYFVTVTSDEKCANKPYSGGRIVVKVKPYATGADLVTSAATICYGTTATLTTSSTLTSPVFTWYSDAALTQQVGTGTSFTTPNLTAGTDYYVTVSSTTKCANQVGSTDTAKVTVNPYATDADVNVSDAGVCTGSSVTLTASSSTLAVPVTFTWYSDPSLSNASLVNTGASYTVNNITANKTYYVAVSNAAECSNLANTGKAVNVTVKQYATTANVSAAAADICKGTSATLVGSSSLTGATFTWYTNATLTTLLGTGDSIVTPALTANTTYYVTVTNDAYCANKSGAAASVTVKVKDYATTADVSAAATDVCTGSTSTLTAKSTTITGGTYTWFGNAALTDTLGTGVTYTTDPLTAAATYYVTVSSTAKCANVAGAAAGVAVKVKQYATAADLSATAAAVCSGSTGTITATSSLTGATFTWYRDAALTSKVGTGTSYTTLAINADSTYYVTVSNADKCANQAGSAYAVTVKVKEYATAADVTATAPDICYNTKATFTASSTATLSNPVYSWYSDASLAASTKVGTGVTYTSNALTANKTFYVTVSSDELCANKATAAASATVTVKPYATASDLSAIPDTICPGETAHLTASTNLTDAVIKWYGSAALSDSVGAGTTFSVDGVTATRYYYLSVSNADKCANLANTGKSVAVVVNGYAAASDITVTSPVICTGSTATITAGSSTLTSPTFTWYSDAALTTPIATGTTYTTPELTAGATYYVSVSNANKCNNLANTGKDATVKVNAYATAADLSASAAAVCAGSAATITATSSLTGTTFTWYRDAALTSKVATGASYITPALNADSTYYVTVSNADKCANQANEGYAVTAKVKQYATAADVTASAPDICYNTKATFTASSTATLTNAVYTWYSDAGLTARLGTGTSYTTATTLTTGKTYYVTVASDELCANKANTAASATVKVKTYAAASDLTVVTDTICTGSQATLQATTSLADAVIKWYSNSTLADSIGVGNSYTTSVLTANTTYYVSVSNADKCNNLSGAGATAVVKVNTYAAASDVSATAAAICTGSTATITATSSLTGATFTWYRDAALTDQVGTGATFTTPALIDDSTYYVTVSNVNKCNNQSGNGHMITVKVKEYATDADITAADTAICTGSAVKLTASAALTGAAITWYKDAALTIVAGTGATYTTPALTATTTYYVSVSNTDKCANKPNEGKAVEVKVKTYSVSADVSVVTDTICSGTSATLTASTSLPDAVIKWYSNATLTDSVGVGTAFVTPVLTAAKSYYVSVSNADQCNNKANAGTVVAVKVNSYSTAANITASDAVICTGSQATLSAGSSLSNAVFTWYRDAALTDSAGTGTDFVTPVLTAGTGYYYVTVKNVDKCNNLANTGKQVTVKVNDYATAADITVADTSICSGESITLKATSSLTGATIKWYRDEALTDSVGVSGNFTTPALTSAATYYISISNADKCANPSGTGKPVSVTIKAYATAADIALTPDTICTGSNTVLTATSTLDNPVFKWYKDAGLTVLLGTGNTYTTPALTQTTTYYVSVNNADRCFNLPNTGNSVQVKVNEYAAAADISAVNDTICTGSAAILTATTGLDNAVIKWYSNAGLTDSVGTGFSYTTPVLATGTTHYYISISNADKCFNKANAGATVAVKVNDYATAADITATGAAICTGSAGIVTAASPLTGAVFTWYADAALTDSVGTGAGYTTPVLTTGTTTYYVTVHNADKCRNPANAAQTVAVKVKDFAGAADIAATPDTICTGAQAHLTAASTLPGAVIKWYSNAGLTDSVGVGNNYTTPVLTAGTTYYVSVSNDDKCANQAGTGKEVAVKVNTFATGADITLTADTICKGTAATLTAGTGLADATIKWYSNAALTDSVGVGTSYTTPVLTGNTTYYVSVSNYDKCNNLAGTGAAAAVKVNDFATAADITAAADTVCTGSAAVLEASSSLPDATIKWYSNAALTDSVGVGTSYITPVLTAGTTYYVSVSNVDKCNNLAGAGKTVAVKVNEFATAADLAVVTDTVCTGSQAVLTASSSLAGAQFIWYSNADLTDSVAAGVRFITPALTATTTYYVSVKNADKCNNLSGNGKEAVVKVNEYATAADVTVVTDTVCSGSQAVLTASANLPGAVIRWYSNAALTDSVGVGTSYTTPVLTAGTNYYVSVSNVDKCANTADNGNEVIVKVNTYAVAADVQVTGDSVCYGTQATLTAVTALPGAAIKWYTNATLTDSVGFGASYTTPALTAGKQYYVSVSNVDKCFNLANTGASATVKVKPFATSADVSVVGDTICTGSQATLKVTSSLTGATFTWYSSAALTDSIGTGASFTTPALTGNTYYYVSVKNADKCNNQAGNAGSAMVKVKPFAAAADIYAGDTTICSNTYAVLTAGTATVVNPVYTWYKTAGGAALQSSSNPAYNTGTLAAAATYYVTVKGDNACENLAAAARQVVVSMKYAPVITTQPKGLGSICEGRATGFSVIASGDSLRYQWQLNKNDGSGFADLTGDTTYIMSVPVITLSMSGYQYRCIVRNTCGEVTSTVVVLTVNAAPKVTRDPVDTIVCVKGNASFSVTATGTGVLSYVWQVNKNDGTGFMAIAGATAAAYTASAVTEAMNGYQYRCIVSGGCAPPDTSLAAVLTVPVARVGAIGTQVLCNNTPTSEVSLTSSITGTSYTWVNNNTLIGLAASGTGSIASFTAVNREVLPDTATIIVTPVAYGCTGEKQTFLFVVNPSPLLSSESTGRVCSDNVFNYTATTGTPGTTLVWTRAAVAGISNGAATGNGNISETLTDTTLAAVNVVYNYTLVANSCSFTQPVTVTVRPKPVVTVEGNTVCAETAVVLTANADLSGATYSWNTPDGKTATGQTYNIASAATSQGGVYQVVATKDNCTSDAARATLVVKALPAVTVTGDTGVCVGQTLTLSASSDIGSDGYTWSGPSGFSTTQRGFTINNMSAVNQGVYSVQILKNGCASHNEKVTVVVNDYPVVSIQKSSVACENASVWVRAISNLPLSTYIWEGTGINATSGQELTIKPVSGQTLKIYVVVSKNNCAVKDSVEFQVKASPAVVLPALGNVCQNDSSFRISASETSGLPGSGAFSGASITTDGVFTPGIAAGTYIVTYTYTTTDGCTDSKSGSFKVYPMPDVDAGSDKQVYLGNSTRLDGNISGTYVSYTWSEVGNAAFESFTTLQPTIAPTEDKTYVLSAINSYGCKSDDSVDVKVMQFRVPNSFSPNGDGINDTWNIPGLSKYPNSRVEIYNRWGTRLFLSKGYVQAWDGKYNGAYVPAATYYYLIYLNDGLNEKPISGWIEVMR